jgi:hypothetical protein
MTQSAPRHQSRHRALVLDVDGVLCPLPPVANNADWITISAGGFDDLVVDRAVVAWLERIHTIDADLIVLSTWSDTMLDSLAKAITPLQYAELISADGHEDKYDQIALISRRYPTTVWMDDRLSGRNVSPVHARKTLPQRGIRDTDMRWAMKSLFRDPS